jgi:hypothetical protein
VVVDKKQAPVVLSVSSALFGILHKTHPIVLKKGHFPVFFGIVSM